MDDSGVERENLVLEGSSARAGVARLALGLIQGLVLYGLYEAYDSSTWPTGHPALFSALVLIFLFVPLLAEQGLGTMRPRTALIWSFCAAVVLAALACWDRARAIPAPHEAARDFALPSWYLFVCAAAGLFIAQALIVAADQSHRLIAPYKTYFVTAWKQELQRPLAAAFVLTFWLILWLGAGLFHLIHIDAFRRLIEHRWFECLATALAAAAALHLTDVRHGLLAGIRNVALVLLSWLLPVLALIAGTFLLSLFFTGLQPLWQTRSAAAILLGASAWLVVLINAAWQAGPAEHEPPLLLRLGGTLAALLLLPITLLAAYALALRVAQYGWTTDRVAAAAVAAVALCYAAGYAWAAVNGSIRHGLWLDGLAPSNIAAAFFTLAVLLAVLSPVADPARIAVASQVARLRAGEVAPDRFDFRYLHFDSARFGVEALKDLAANASGPNGPAIRKRATAELQMPDRYAPVPLPMASPAARRKLVHVYPKDYPLPQSLFVQDWRGAQGFVPPCLSGGTLPCDVFPASLTGARPDQLIFVWGDPRYLSSSILSPTADGHWAAIGTLHERICPKTLEAMRNGQYAVVAPTPPPFRAVEAGGQRFAVDGNEPAQPPCR